MWVGDRHFGSDRGWEPALWGMIALSAVLHVIAAVLILVAPKEWFSRAAPPLVSYTVDLVAPEQLGGTNLVEGGQGRTRGQTMAAAEGPPPPPPPPKQPEQARAPQPPSANKPEPVAESREADKAVALAPPTATRVPPTRTATPVAVAAVKVAPPTVPPVAPRVEEQLRRKAQEEQAKRQAEEAERSRREEEAKRRVATAEAAKRAQATATAAAEAKQREQIEQQIVAAAKRLQAQQGERGAGTGAKKGAQAGGPLSVGPGQGAGGQVMGIDYVLYLGQLERKLKENWAWAGTNDALEAVVGFSILPDGKVVNVRILKSSGDRSFDLSVERTVRALDPMPPPPEAYRELFGDVQYTFNAKSMQN